MSNIDVENPEKRKLNKAVDEFAYEMKKRLFQKADEGYSGWDDDKYIEYIEEKLYETYETVMTKISINEGCAEEIKEKFIDMANLVMMLSRFYDDN